MPPGQGRREGEARFARPGDGRILTRSFFFFQLEIATVPPCYYMSHI